MKRILIIISLMICVLITNAQSDYTLRLEERSSIFRDEFEHANNAFNLIYDDTWKINSQITFGDILEYQEYCYADSLPIYKWYYIKDKKLKSGWFKWGEKPDAKSYQLSSETKYIHPKKATFEGFIGRYKNR